MIGLIQEFGAHAGRRFSFAQERVRMGRQPNCDVSFDPNIDLDSSGVHCEIVREGPSFVLVDLQSRNGTFVNGQRISRQPLRQGDLIECGRGGPRIRVESLAQLAAPANPFAPPAAQGQGQAQGFAPQPPQQVSQSAPVPQPASVGAALAAGMPAGAQVGKHTVAMMIDQALVASEQQRARKTGGGKTGLFVGLFLVTVVAVAGAVAVVVLRGERGGATQTQGGGEQISAEYESAIYLLAARVPGAAAPRGFCTGFSVGPNLIATNAHCIDAGRQFLTRGAALIALRSSGHGEQIEIVPVYRDSRFRDPVFGLEGSGFDVGLLRSASTLPVSVRVAADNQLRSLRAGSQLFVFGFPGMTMNGSSPVATITQGVLNRSTDFFERAADTANAQKLQHSAQTTSGSSGSPIFLSDGSVIGVNAGSLSDEERQRILDPRTGQTTQVEVNRSSNFKYGIRADIIRDAVNQLGDSLP
ncbi:MAG: trypsin-like peptidase domain-containing protein [Deltaproteobacteria bacterium]|nr:trypsin-like peptidase domain-containing protein [Deltaproteobacteria bacterium]